MLGSDRSNAPMIMNAGAMLTGVATLIAAAGFFRALSQLGTNRVITWLTTLALVSSGLASIWAGTFPLPDPRHNPGPLGIGMFLLPALFLLATWKLDSRAMRIYLIANLLLMVALIPVMSGKAGMDLASYAGLFQRIAASTLMIPVAVVAYFLLKRTH